MILKNVASQGIYLFAYTTSGAKTGDAANITGYSSIDGTTTGTVFGTAHPTEISATNLPGVYWQPLAQSETNGNAIAYNWASSTSGVSIDPVLVLTSGVNFPVAAYAASGGFLTYGTSTGQINPSSGKIAATLASTDVSGNVPVDLQTIKTQTVTAAAGVTFPASIGTSTYTGSDTAGTTTLLTRIPGAITLNSGMVEVDLQTIKGQAVTAASPVTVPASIGTSTYAGADTAGTTTLLTRLPGAITLNGGFVAADLQTIKQQAVTAAAGVTFPASIQATTTFPTNFSSLSIDTNGRAKIQGGLTKNSAITLTFYMALSSDHVSPATGKSVTATVSLDGGTFSATSNSPVEIANGWYKISLLAADTNGNVMALSFAASSCDTTQATFIMQP